MSSSDYVTLLRAAESAESMRLPPDQVRYTTELADALGVSRQAVHAWRRFPNSPRRTGGFWSICEWQAFMKVHNLAEMQPVDRATVLSEICTLVLDKLPPRLTRKRLHELLGRVEIALHSALPGSRFRSGACVGGRVRKNV
jgi:hypothetical protein